MKTIKECSKFSFLVGDEVGFIHQPLQYIRDSWDSGYDTELKTNDKVFYEFNELHEDADYPMFLGVVTEVDDDHICIREERYGTRTYTSSSAGPSMTTKVLAPAIIQLDWDEVDMLVKAHRLATVEKLREMRKNKKDKE